MKKVITKNNLMHLAFILAVYLFVSWIKVFYMMSNASADAIALLIKSYNYIPSIHSLTEMNIFYSLPLIIFFFLWKNNYFTRNR
tara:strand:- start:87 stop:338 length:252 start_codon:yes stop_codon:yes gene_type:complete